MLKQQERQVWANASAIPFQLCDDAQPLHHSVFVCPVSREKNSLADPPVRLTCGPLLLPVVQLAQTKYSDEDVTVRAYQAGADRPTDP